MDAHGAASQTHYPKELKSLGDHLKACRLDLGLTQKQAAVKLAVDAGSVGNWEISRTSIKTRYYPALIEFLGYNPLPEPTSPGQAIRRARMTRGWSRRKLACAAGLDEATVSRIETDTKGIARRSWTRIEGVLR